MNRRSIFAGLLAALPGVAKVPQSQPMGDLISDSREWKHGEDRPYCRTFVNGVEVRGVYYINFTKGFVRNYLMNGDDFVYVRPYIETWSGREYPEDGHCFIPKYLSDGRGGRFMGYGDRKQMKIPDGYEIQSKDAHFHFLHRTIYGEIETRPL